MHADELDIDVHLVHRLVASQFPHWATLPLAPVPSAGTDNAIYRFGRELVARLPRSPSRVAPLVNERTWLPRLGSLPLAVPVTVAEGAPGEGYPWTWSVYRWLEGDTRRRNASPTSSGRRSTSQSSLAPCSGSIPPAGRRPVSTTSAVASPSHDGTTQPAER
jgi:aminoglycoside phosphotransferase (APT) family kinase protein